MRPLKINIIDKNKNLVLKVEKKFAFFLPEFKIYTNEKLIGIVKSRFGLKSKLEIFDSNGNFLFFCSNKVMHPWTFNIYKNKNNPKDEESIAVITKK